jgi:hypothetical protein
MWISPSATYAQRREAYALRRAFRTPEEKAREQATFNKWFSRLGSVVKWSFIALLALAAALVAIWIWSLPPHHWTEIDWLIVAVLYAGWRIERKIANR